MYSLYEASTLQRTEQNYVLSSSVFRSTIASLRSAIKKSQVNSNKFPRTMTNNSETSLPPAESTVSLVIFQLIPLFSTAHLSKLTMVSCLTISLIFHKPRTSSPAFTFEFRFFFLSFHYCRNSNGK